MEPATEPAEELVGCHEGRRMEVLGDGGEPAMLGREVGGGSI